jgi:hypothetical protein
MSISVEFSRLLGRVFKIKRILLLDVAGLGGIDGPSRQINPNDASCGITQIGG